MSIEPSPDDLLSERERSQKHMQLTLGTMALGSVAFGLGMYVMSDRLGLPDETAKIVASAFLIAASLDALVLYSWERLFGPRG